MQAYSDRLAVPITRLWKMLQGIGLERVELLHQGGEYWLLRGTILRLHDNRPVEAQYSIECDSRWHTTSATIDVWDGHHRRLFVEHQGGHWVANRDSQPQLNGCIDIDLGWSPSTNTLPIRRLNLANGTRSGPLIAAWVKFPELVLEPLPQEYVRVADRAYRYSSRSGTFTADLSVDEYGLVDQYEGFWKRVLEQE